MRGSSLVTMFRVMPSATGTSRADAGPAAWRSPGEVQSSDVPAWLRQLVWWMDSAFAVPGTNLRIGLDPLIGLLLPGAGDLLGAIPSFLLLSLASKLGVPPVVIARMVLNVALDSLIGAVPLLGDIFDGTFHANEKNLALLERHAGPPRPVRVRDYLMVGGAILFAACCVVLPVLLVVLLVKALAGG